MLRKAAETSVVQLLERVAPRRPSVYASRFTYMITYTDSFFVSSLLLDGMWFCQKRSNREDQKVLTNHSVVFSLHQCRRGRHRDDFKHVLKFTFDVRSHRESLIGSSKCDAECV